VGGVVSRDWDAEFADTKQDLEAIFELLQQTTRVVSTSFDRAVSLVDEWIASRTENEDVS
jgi:hypothetical protein